MFERFYYFLDDCDDKEMGIVIFDEFDQSQSRVLLDQMTGYFIKTEKGRIRSSQIIPEPFFVHSDLTIGVQLADFAAYILSWGFYLKEMKQPRREELKPLVSLLCDMRVSSKRLIPEISSSELSKIMSIAFIDH